MFNVYKRYGLFIAMLSLCSLMASCQFIEEAAGVLGSGPEPNTVIYTIPKGAHSSLNSRFKQVKTTKLRFEVTFDKSAIYTCEKAENQADINKLYGLSDCGTHHHVNSARFGWRWLNNRLELLAYAYVDGVRKYEYITSIDLEKPVVCELTLEDNQYRFRVGEKVTILPRACSGSLDAYQLYPYFGGDEVAPHDIQIKIKDLL